MTKPFATARLVIVDGPCANTVYPLSSGLTVIGRLGGENALVLDEPTVSRVHARFLVEADGVYVEDLQSLQGTWTNGVWSRRRKLEHGDKVAIGDVVLQFLCD